MEKPPELLEAGRLHRLTARGLRFESFIVFPAHRRKILGVKGRWQNREMPGSIVAKTVGGQIETLTPDLIILLGPGNPRSRESRVWSVSKISRNKHRAMRQNSSHEPPDWDHIVYQHRLRQLSKSAAARFQYRPDTR